MGILAAAEIADFSERSNITHLLHFHAREQSNLNLPLSAGSGPLELLEFEAAARFKQSAV